MQEPKIQVSERWGRAERIILGPGTPCDVDPAVSSERERGETTCPSLGRPLNSIGPLKGSARIEPLQDRHVALFAALCAADQETGI